MAQLRELRNYKGEKIFMNAELVTAVTPGREEGKSLVYCGGSESGGYLVQGEPAEVASIIWPSPRLVPPR